MNLFQLVRGFAAQPYQRVVRVFYFSAYATWIPAAYARHRVYVAALESVGVTPIMGNFKQKTRSCNSCGASWLTHEEKETDVSIALNMLNVAWLGVLIFSGGAVFALATLPVEFNASARAKAMLAESGIIMGEDEQRGVNAVLNAAALTYVAALFTAVMQLLYYASLVLGSGRRR